jgi:hypothetical protein
VSVSEGSAKTSDVFLACTCSRCSSLFAPLAIHEYISHPSRRFQPLRTIPLLLPISLSGWSFFLRFQHLHFGFFKFAFAFLVIYSSFWKPSFGTSFEEHEARSRKIHSREKIRREKRQQEWAKKGRQHTRRLFSSSGFGVMGFSNLLSGILNFVTFVLSIPIIGAGIWLAKQHNTVCVRFLQWPVIIIGVFILLVSLAGVFGAWCRVSCLLWLYLFVMFVLILLLFVFTIFAFAVTNAGAGQALSGKGYKEYHLGDYSTWLQRRVNNPSNWNTIQSCLSDAKVCNGLDNQYPTLAQFNAASLTPIEVLVPSGPCCYCFIGFLQGGQVGYVCSSELDALHVNISCSARKGICAMVSAMCHCPHSLSHKQVCHDQNKTDNLLFSFAYCSRGVASHLPVVILHS